jgi:hypothetical protein
MYVMWWVVGVAGRRGAPRSSVSIIIEQLHQQQASSQGEGESKNHKNGEEMPQTLMSTFIDCYFFYV